MLRSWLRISSHVNEWISYMTPQSYACCLIKNHCAKNTTKKIWTQNKINLVHEYVVKSHHWQWTNCSHTMSVGLSPRLRSPTTTTTMDTYLLLLTAILCHVPCLRTKRHLSELDLSLSLLLTSLTMFMFMCKSNGCKWIITKAFFNVCTYYLHLVLPGKWKWVTKNHLNFQSRHWCHDRIPKSCHSAELLKKSRSSYLSLYSRRLLFALIFFPRRSISKK